MNSNKRPVTVEDLMRVKRAERPPAEFWAQFDRELRMRQLAAIVEPRPWWAPFIRVGARVSRHQLPIGAVAILALSFVTIREYRTNAFQPTFTPEVRAPELTVAMPDTTHLVAAISADDEVEVDEPTTVATAETHALGVDAALSTGHDSHVVPILGRVAEREPSPSERYIAENLAAAKAADPLIVDEVFGSPMRTVEPREQVRDPLIQVASVGESRRSRLLTSALPASSGSSEVAVGSSARVVRRLTEDRLYDSISRIGVRGDRVAIKF